MFYARVSKELRANEDFKKELCSCVWSELIEPHVFEASWKGIMLRYGLNNEEWFNTMYDDREFWVPAYFRDFPFSGLLKTTSIAECENSFFKRYTKSSSNLLEFWMSFNSAIDSQRHTNARLNYIDSTSVPTLLTKMPLEKHAATIFTSKIFSQVQQEITSAYFNCCIQELNASVNNEQYSITDEFEDTVVVIYNKVDETYTCGCKMFCRLGMLCRHILYVFKNKGIKAIPEKYAAGRWRKLHMVKPVHDIRCDDVQLYVGVDENQRLINKLMSSLFGLIQELDGQTQKLSTFLNDLENSGKILTGKESMESAVERKKLLEEFYGPVPEKIEIHPPNVVKTKGSGSRILSRKEAAIRAMNKPLRKCAKCKQLAHHDARNCDKLKKKIME